jgi:hypothetical protein
MTRRIKRVGHLIKEWKEALQEDKTANGVILASVPTKRKAVSMALPRAPMWNSGNSLLIILLFFFYSMAFPGY